MLDTIFLQIAKSAILSKFDDKYKFDRDVLLNKYPFLQKSGAAFVTLKSNGDLRGCIGSVVAHRMLLDDVIHNAVSAGFGDPRFHSLNQSELSHLSLEVSVLTEPKSIEYSDFDDLCEKLKPKIDGVILSHESYHGTFLPQVWQQLPSAKLFLEHLSMKAGADISIYEKHPTIYRYNVNSIEESFDKVMPL